MTSRCSNIHTTALFLLVSGSPLSRSTVVTAVKFTIVDHPMPIDSLLKGCIGKCLIFSLYIILSKLSHFFFFEWTVSWKFELNIYVVIFLGDFLKTLQDPDLNVRRVALVTFNSAAHNKPSLIRGLLTSLLPHLYNETQIRKDLVREVQLTNLLQL